MPRAIDNGEFVLSGKCNRPRQFSSRSINYGDIAAVGIYGEHALRKWVVCNRVRFLSSLYLSNYLERLKVKDRDGAGMAVRCKAAAKIRSKRNAVDSIGIGDFANDFLCVHVNHDHFGAARDEKPSSRGVELQVIPKWAVLEFLAGERDFFQQMISRRPWRCGQRRWGRIRRRFSTAYN